MEEQQLSQLEELAKAATPGPWYVYSEAYGDECGPLGHDLYITPQSGGYYDEQGEANDIATVAGQIDAEYIAAVNPTTTLSLIAEIRRLRAATPSLPVQGEIAEGVPTEQLENLIHRAGKAYPGPYMVELTGTRHRFFTVNGGKHVLRKLMSEYELFELTAEAGSQLRATDAYMAAADPQTVASMAQELLARRTSSSSLLVESKQEGILGKQPLYFLNDEEAAISGVFLNIEHIADDLEAAGLPVPEHWVEHTPKCANCGKRTMLDGFCVNNDCPAPNKEGGSDAN